MNDLIERLRLGDGTSADHELLLEAADALEALAQSDQEPVAYDKTEMNCFVQDLYDKKMQEGKHGHYETMFHVVHQAIKKVPPQRTWAGLTLDDIPDDDTNNLDFYRGGRWAERVLKDKNTSGQE